MDNATYEWYLCFMMAFVRLFDVSICNSSYEILPYRTLISSNDKQETIFNSLFEEQYMMDLDGL